MEESDDERADSAGRPKLPDPNFTAWIGLQTQIT